MTASSPGNGGSIDAGGKRGFLTQLWRQLPFFVWLIALWMLLWGQFTVVAFVTGLVAAQQASVQQLTEIAA